MIRRIAESHTSSKDHFDQQLSQPATDGPRHQVQLTTFTETESELDQKPKVVPEFIYRMFSNPYPDQTPKEILERNYKVASYNWGPAFTYATLNFPQALLNQPTIINVLKPFERMRAGAKFEVRINSSAFHMGTIMISYIPNHVGNKHFGTSIVPNTVIKNSGNRPVILSASTQDAATIVLPWVNPYNYFKLQGTVGSEIAQVRIAVLNPLLATSETVSDTVEIQVYAAFTDVEVAYYVQAQSGRNKFVKESIAKSKEGLTVIKDTAHAANGILDAVPIVGDVISSIGSFFGLMDKPVNVAAAQAVYREFAPDLCSGEGLSVGRELSLIPLSFCGDKSKMMGDDNPGMEILKIISTPMLRKVFTFTNVNKSFDFACHIQDSLDYTEDDYLAFMARQFEFWRGSFKYMLLFRTSTFISARFRITVLYAPLIDVNRVGDTVTNIVDVKGDTNYKFTVPFLWDTMYRRFNDVTATTAYPRIQISLVSTIIGPSLQTNPVVYCNVFRSAGPDFVLKQLVCPRPYPTLDEIVPKKRKKVQAQLDVCSEFKHHFNPILEGSKYIYDQDCVIPEKIQSVRQIIKRFAPQAANGIAGTFPITGGTINGSYYYMGAVYKYWSGSRRIKFRFDSTQAVGPTTVWPTVVMGNNSGPGFGASTNIANGAQLTNLAQFGGWPMLSAEIPWYCTIPYAPVDGTTITRYDAGDIPQDYITTTLPNNTEKYISAGDDFQYCYLISPDYR